MALTINVIVVDQNARETRELAKSNSTVIMPLLMQNPKPRLILGLMTFGPDESAGARITSLDEYNKCLDYFQQQGYNEVDTARVYIGGKQEAFTAAAHWKERGLTIATKWYPKEPGAHKANVIKEQVNISLKELQTDCVDIFYLHAPDRSVPFEETLEAVNELHKEGKFVQLGLSNFTAFEVAEIVITCKDRGWVRPSIYQGMYNAISRSPSLSQCRSLYLIITQHDRSNTNSFLVANGTELMWSYTTHWQVVCSPGRSKARISLRKDGTVTKLNPESYIESDTSKMPHSMLYV